MMMIHVFLLQLVILTAFSSTHHIVNPMKRLFCMDQKPTLLGIDFRGEIDPRGKLISILDFGKNCVTLSISKLFDFLNKRAKPPTLIFP